jgi:hypothetical protein
MHRARQSPGTSEVPIGATQQSGLAEGEQNLFERCIHRAPGAWEELCRKYFKILARCASCLVPWSDGEDRAQSALERFNTLCSRMRRRHNSGGTLPRLKIGLLPLLFKLLGRADTDIYRYIKRAKRIPPRLFGPPEDVEDPHGDALPSSDRRAEARHALRLMAERLSKHKWRWGYTLARLIDGATEAMIAEELHKTPEAVKQIWARARRWISDKCSDLDTQGYL